MIPSFVILLFHSLLGYSSPTTDAIITVFDNRPLHKLSKQLSGTNANPFSGQMIDQPKLLSHVKNLKPNFIRFPGGDISNLYFWNRDKWNPPQDVPANIFLSKKKAPIHLWYGINKEPWTMSLENYYKLLKLISSEGMITVNYAYARYGTGKNPVADAAHLAANWVRFDNGRTKYWEIGNENYGYWEAGWKIEQSNSQPEIITGKLYGTHFKIFADSMRKAAKEKNQTIQIGAQLVTRPVEKSISPSEEFWNTGYFGSAGDIADFYIIHEYFTPYGENNTADEILRSATVITRQISSVLKECFIKNKRKTKPIALTEWNIFSTGNNQKTSTIAGVQAVIALLEMQESKFTMAARWGLLGKYSGGDDFGTFNIGDEPGDVKKWQPRPIFYYLYFYQRFLGDYYIQTIVKDNKSILAYASKFQSDELSTIIVNTANKMQTVRINLATKQLKSCSYFVLSGEKNQIFSKKLFINNIGPNGASGGPENYDKIEGNDAEIKEKTIIVRIPPYGTIFLKAKN